MTFPCPGCGEQVRRSPEAWALRCPACRVVIRSRAVDGGEDRRLYDIEVAGRPETRRRVEVAWTPEDQGRLRAWLTWSSVITLGLIVLLYALARWIP